MNKIINKKGLLIVPNWAYPLALALAIKAFYPASKFSGLPAHAAMVLFYKALPYENVKAHGLLILVILFISFKLSDASSSDYPPDKN